MKVTIDKPKRSTYFDIKINGIGGLDDKAQKEVVLGSIFEYMAKSSRKTKIVRKSYEA